MKDFAKRYDGWVVESGEQYPSEAFGILAVRFRHALMESLPEFSLWEYTKEARRLSGIIGNGDVLIGFSWNLPRGPINCKDKSPEGGVHIFSDGEEEEFCSISGLPKAVRTFQRKLEAASEERQDGREYE